MKACHKNFAEREKRERTYRDVEIGGGGLYGAGHPSSTSRSGETLGSKRGESLEWKTFAERIPWEREGKSGRGRRKGEILARTKKDRRYKGGEYLRKEKGRGKCRSVGRANGNRSRRKACGGNSGWWPFRRSSVCSPYAHFPRCIPPSISFSGARYIPPCRRQSQKSTDRITPYRASSFLSFPSPWPLRRTRSPTSVLRFYHFYRPLPRSAQSQTRSLVKFDFSERSLCVDAFKHWLLIRNLIWSALKTIICTECRSCRICATKISYKIQISFAEVSLAQFRRQPSCTGLNFDALKAL